MTGSPVAGASGGSRSFAAVPSAYRLHAPTRTSLPRSGPPPIPGEGPDLPRWNHRPGRDNAHASRSGAANGVHSSTIWSGLIDTGTTYTAVSGHWTVPFIRASTSREAVATWVGISGISHTTTLIQTGVDGITTGGTVSSIGRCTVPVMMTGAVDQHRPMEKPGCQGRRCRCTNARRSLSR